MACLPLMISNSKTARSQSLDPRRKINREGVWTEDTGQSLGGLEQIGDRRAAWRRWRHWREKKRCGHLRLGLTRLWPEPDYDKPKPYFPVSCSCRVRRSCQKLPTLHTIYPTKISQFQYRNWDFSFSFSFFIFWIFGQWFSLLYFQKKIF